MSRHYYDTAGQETPVFYPVGYSFGLGYKDECTTLTVRYSSSLSAPAAYPIYAGGPVDLQSGRPQPDPDVPARPAHARRRQGERRPLTA